MDSPASESGPTLVVELHPRRVIVEAGACPLESTLVIGCGAYKRRKEVYGAPQRPEERPRHLTREDGYQIRGAEGGFPCGRIAPTWNIRVREEATGGDEEEKAEKRPREESENNRLLHGTIRRRRQMIATDGEEERL